MRSLRGSRDERIILRKKPFLFPGCFHLFYEVRDRVSLPWQLIERKETLRSRVESVEMKPEISGAS